MGMSSTSYTFTCSLLMCASSPSAHFHTPQVSQSVSPHTLHPPTPPTHPPPGPAAPSSRALREGRSPFLQCMLRYCACLATQPLLICLSICCCFCCCKTDYMRTVGFRWLGCDRCGIQGRRVPRKKVEKHTEETGRQKGDLQGWRPHKALHKMQPPASPPPRSGAAAPGRGGGRSVVLR